MNVAALVEYDGARFIGFQRQSPTRGATIQGALEDALWRLSGERITLVAAGRTDTGVHASGQVITFPAPAHLERRFSPTRWRDALNALLPSDVAVRAVCFTADSVHARKSALTRRYRYRIFSAEARAPLRERYAWRVERPVDLSAMTAAAQALLGERDFGAFGSSPRDDHSAGVRGHTIRVMRVASCRWRPAAPGEPPDEIEYLFEADAFLTGMVRRLVGSLVMVGDGRLSLDEFKAILVAANKNHRGVAAPPHGLCFVGATYPAGLLDWPPTFSAPFTG